MTNKQRFLSDWIYEMKKFAFTFAFLVFASVPVQAQEMNWIILQSIFEGCMSAVEPGEQAYYGMYLEYCGCYTHGISKTITAEELMELGLDFQDSESEIEDSLLSNKKFRKIIVKCGAKIIEN